MMLRVVIHGYICITLRILLTIKIKNMNITNINRKINKKYYQILIFIQIIILNQIIKKIKRNFNSIIDDLILL